MTPKAKPAPVPDPGDLPCPVPLLTRMVQTGIRLIPDSSTRQRCWSIYLHRLEQAQLRDDSRMPWDGPEAVTTLPHRIAQDIAIAVIRECPDDDIAARMVKVMTKIGNDYEKDRARNPVSPRSGKYPPQQCARPGCGVVYVPQRPNGKYHNDNCRQAHYQMRKKSKADDAHSG